MYNSVSFSPRQESSQRNQQEDCMKITFENKILLPKILQ